MKPKQQKGGMRPVKKTTLAFDKELHKRLRIFSIEEDVSMTAVVEEAVREYMAQRRGKGGK